MRGQTQHPVRTEGFAATQGRDVVASRGVPGGQIANMFAGTVGGVCWPGGRVKVGSEQLGGRRALLWGGVGGQWGRPLWAPRQAPRLCLAVSPSASRRLPGDGGAGGAAWHRESGPHPGRGPTQSPPGPGGSLALPSEPQQGPRDCDPVASPITAQPEAAPQLLRFGAGGPAGRGWAGHRVFPRDVVTALETRKLLGLDGLQALGPCQLQKLPDRGVCARRGGREQ